MRANSFLLPVLTLGPAVAARLAGIPTLPFESSSKTGATFDVYSVQRIRVDSQHASAVDDSGWTLIPPTLEEFGKTFASDLNALLASSRDRNSTAGNVTIISASDDFSKVPEIFLTLGDNTGFKDAAGRPTSEGYQLDVTRDGIVITGASPLGCWWGTRSVLQQAVLHRGKIPAGAGVDAPGWNTRGVFLDAGRHFYPVAFLVDLCNWMSFWKQNTFHLHLSDNLYNNVAIYSRERQLDLYARFRLWSDEAFVAGLNKHANESYTREDFDQIQQSCAARGVTVIPEIEAPGHALVISQWKPELGLSDSLDLLNISARDTIPTMEKLWSTFLPWFHSKVVHIGADEYVDSSLTTFQLAEDYNRFVNTLGDYIFAESGKQIRIWGTYPPQKNYTANIPANVTLQHWEFFEDNPLTDYINNGYNVINSDDQFYIVQKTSGSYPQTLNRSRIFHGDPAGGAFAPNVFDSKNATNNPPRDSSYVPGHIAAQWNDYGYNTSTYLEAYYAWRDLLPALADKQWGGDLSDEEYDDLFDKLQPVVPEQNLDRTIASRSSTILQYSLAEDSDNSTLIKDLSGNGYDGQTNCPLSNGAIQFSKACKVTTPLTSKGRNYTLSFDLNQASASPGPLFSGPDSILASGNGSSSAIMLIAAGYAFPLNYSLPVGQWVSAKLIGRGNQTFFSVDGGWGMEFTAKIGINGESYVWSPISVVAPIQAIGGGSWEGSMKNVTLLNHA